MSNDGLSRGSGTKIPRRLARIVSHFLPDPCEFGPQRQIPSLKGAFILDFEGLEKTNVLIGEGSWGDNEQAIAKKRTPKDGRTLYLDLLPFYVEKKRVYGFLTTEPVGDKVVVWAVHTFVHDYPTFDDWLSREGSAARSKKKPRPW